MTDQTLVDIQLKPEGLYAYQQQVASTLALTKKMAKDRFHGCVKTALIKAGWSITHDPFSIPISEAIKIQIDLGAEHTIAAERQQEKIAVEIKSFVAESDISEFHGALGQYLNYSQALEEKEPERALYLAVPGPTYRDFFQLPFIQKALNRHGINLIIYNPTREDIEKWIRSNNTAM